MHKVFSELHLGDRFHRGRMTLLVGHVRRILLLSTPDLIFLVLVKVPLRYPAHPLFGIARLNLGPLEPIELGALAQLLNVAITKVKNWSPSLVFYYQFELVRSPALHGAEVP